MTDLVKKLRSEVHEFTWQPDVVRVLLPTPLALEAADEIDRLKRALRGVCNAFEARGLRLQVNDASVRMTDAIIEAKRVLGDLEKPQTS